MMYGENNVNSVKKVVYDIHAMDEGAWKSILKYTEDTVRFEAIDALSVFMYRGWYHLISEEIQEHIKNNI